MWTDAIDGRPVDWNELMKGYTAQVDWPGASFRPELSAANPDALVILWVRGPDSWYTSCSNTIFEGMGTMVEEGNEWMAAMVRLIEDALQRPDRRPRPMTAALERHNEKSPDDPARTPSRMDPADGWGPICERLRVDVPDPAVPQGQHRGRVPGHGRDAVPGALTSSAVRATPVGPIEWRGDGDPSPFAVRTLFTDYSESNILT